MVVVAVVLASESFVLCHRSHCWKCHKERVRNQNSTTNGIISGLNSSVGHKCWLMVGVHEASLRAFVVRLIVRGNR